MKLLDGYEPAELTDDSIVMEKHFGDAGFIRVIGNPNPSKAEQQECINRIAKILLKGYQRDLAASQTKRET